jgi:hypothetical protein
MRQLTIEGQQKITAIAQRYGVSVDAVVTLLEALIRGQGTMAQFSHAELGGTGQWMQGGMTMVGDMFNHALKAKVDGLCSELARLLANEPLFPPPASSQMQSQTQGGGWPAGGAGTSSPDRVSLFVPAPSSASAGWWPADLGSPAATGSQNGLRYAYFAEKRRLAVDLNGRVTVYDTLDHQISGVGQQQGGGASLTFTSQRGVVRLSELPVVPADKGSAAPLREAPADTRADTELSTADDIFAKIERLAELKQKGILSEEEFAAKKAELLRRL